MSKADRLGAGRFGASHSVSARRAAIGAATGVPTEGIPDPTELPVDKISLNPDNPRSTLGDLTDLAGSLRDHGQKQAITVMNRDAYIKANPQCVDQLEDHTTHVVVDGSSRLVAARDAGLTTVKVMVDDTQGTSEDEILESALVANIHRQDLEPLDEARALERLKAIHGTQEALAKRLHRSQGWVSQRLALLTLTPELQQRLADGKENVDLLRAVGKKPLEQQEAALEELKRRRAKKEQVKATSTQASHAEPKTKLPTTGGQQYYGVMNQGQSVEEAASASSTASQDEGKASEAVPEPRSRSSEPHQAALGKRQETRLPSTEGAVIAQYAIAELSPEQIDVLVTALAEHQAQRAATAAT